MKHPVLASVIALTAAFAACPLAAQAPTATAALSQEHRMLLRCSAAFAIVADAQERGPAGASNYPALAGPGREFFVRASARVMDEVGLDRQQISAALTAEARDLRDAGTLDKVMPVCLPLLVAPDD